MAPLVAQAGVALFLVEHWLGVLQAVQTFAVQMGVAPEHPALVRHCTHLFVVVSQTGVVPEQVLLSVHWTHVPVAEQAGAVGLLAAHWLAVVQAVQTFAVQMGVAAGQLALDTHWTHLFVVGSQTGVAPEQVVLSVHWTQVPLAEHVGVAEFLAKHWLASVQAVQTLATQMGAAPEHSALVRHATHLFAIVSQTGVLPEQVPLSVHWTQVPPAEHAGVAGLLAAHWLAVVQVVQTFAAQMGVAVGQVALDRHCTHCPPTAGVPAGAQTEVVPEHAVAPACSHPTQALPTQNSRAGSLQSPAAAHSTQTPAMHTGRSAWQSPFTLHAGAAVSTATSVVVSTEASLGALASSSASRPSATAGRASPNLSQPAAPLHTQT